MYRCPQARNQRGEASLEKIFAPAGKNVLDVFLNYWT